MRNINNYSTRYLNYGIIIFSLFILNIENISAQNIPKSHPLSTSEAYIKLNGNICLSLTIEEIKEELEELDEVELANPITRSHLFNSDETEHIENAYLLWKVKISTTRNFNEQLERLKQHALISLVTPLNTNSVLYIPNDPSTDISVSHHEGASNVLKRHSFFEAWDIEKGDTNVFIGVVDAGFNLEHEDLKHSIKHNFDDPINGLNDDNDYYNNISSLPLVDNYSGWDLAEWDNDPTQPQGTGEHGTIVAGVISGTPDNGKGIVGTALNSKFVPYKVSPDSDGTFILYGYEGIILAAEQGCKVINCSWGSPAYVYPEDTREIYQNIINYAVFVHDAVIVAAAGNEDAEIDYIPAALDNVCSVTATANNMTKLNRSCYGHSIDIAAFGWNVITTAHDADNSSYKLQVGTSIATPVVSGAAALVRSRFPNLTALEVIEQLKSTGDVCDTTEKNFHLRGKMGTYLNPLAALLDTNNASYKVGIDSTNSALYAGDTLKVFFRIKNILWDSDQNGELKISSSDNSFVVSDQSNTFTIPAMERNEISATYRTDIVLQQDIVDTTNFKVVFNFEQEKKSLVDYKTLELKPELITADYIAESSAQNELYVSDLENSILIKSTKDNIREYKITDLMGYTLLQQTADGYNSEIRVNKSQIEKNRIYLLSVVTEKSDIPVVKKIYVR